MPKLFFDTNALLDAVLDERPESRAARRLITASRNGECDIYISVSSLKDVYYLTCRHYKDEKTARQLIRKYKNSFTVVELTMDILETALESDEPDFEDGLIRASAEQAACDAIITRDASAFLTFTGRKMSPAEALGIYGF